MTTRPSGLRSLRRLAAGWLVVAGVCASGCASLAHSGASAVDLPAFHQVDEGYARGGQPTPEGLERLARMGVKTIISLRHQDSDLAWERPLAEQLGMSWHNLPMSYLWRPSGRQIREFLAVATDPAHRPVFVHCRQGRNRTGVMTAIYRMVHHGWSAADAYREGQQLGLAPWNLLTRYVIFREVGRDVLRIDSQSMMSHDG